MKYLTIDSSVSSSTTQSDFSTLLSHITSREQVIILSQRTLSVTAGVSQEVHLDGIGLLKILAWKSDLCPLSYSTDGGVTFTPLAANVGLLYFKPAVPITSIHVRSLVTGTVNFTYGGDPS